MALWKKWTKSCRKRQQLFVDKALRKANNAIVDSVLKSMERKKDKETKAF